jgi:AcrR family transcriptional regulator
VREAILAAALDLIGDQGLVKPTTREIARRAGVAEASVFYHYKDKVGLLQAVILAGLEPLTALGSDVPARHPDQPLAEALLRIATALESFFDRTMPVLETVQADAALRAEFADRLLEGDRGPHRGVRFVSEYLTGMADIDLIRPDVDAEAAATLLVGTCFLRSWTRHLAGTRRKRTLPDLAEIVQTMAQLLAPPPRPGTGTAHSAHRRHGQGNR